MDSNKLKDIKKQIDCESSSEVGSDDIRIIKDDDLDEMTRNPTVAPNESSSQIYENQIKELIIENESLKKE